MNLRIYSCGNTRRYCPWEIAEISETAVCETVRCRTGYGGYGVRRRVVASSLIIYNIIVFAHISFTRHGRTRTTREMPVDTRATTHKDPALSAPSSSLSSRNSYLKPYTTESQFLKLRAAQARKNSCVQDSQPQAQPPRPQCTRAGVAKRWLHCCQAFHLVTTLAMRGRTPTTLPNFVCFAAYFFSETEACCRGCIL